jgi:hypothetical protein
MYFLSLRNTVSSIHLTSFEGGHTWVPYPKVREINSIDSRRKSASGVPACTTQSLVRKCGTEKIRITISTCAVGERGQSGACTECGISCSGMAEKGVIVPVAGIVDSVVLRPLYAFTTKMRSALDKSAVGYLLSPTASTQ